MRIHVQVYNEIYDFKPIIHDFDDLCSFFQQYVVIKDNWPTWILSSLYTSSSVHTRAPMCTEVK